ncbi:hypothetical protein ACWDRB_47735 [Nonomuraea sp. NPDC003707]
MSLSTTPGRMAVVLTMTAAVLVACSGDPAPACAAVAYGPPGSSSSNSSSSSRSSTSTGLGRTSTSTGQTQPQRQIPVQPPQQTQTRPVQPQGKPTTGQASQQARPAPTSTTLPKYVPAPPKTVTPYSRDPFGSYPTQKNPIWHDGYRQYPGYVGWYPLYVYPIGYAEEYGCTMTGVEGVPAADVNADGIPDEATDW